MNSLPKIITELKKHSVPENKEKMARFGINIENALCVSMPIIRAIAKKIGRDHKLASQLWRTSIPEARILACLIDDPKIIDEKQMEIWVKDFNSWDVCDQCCNNLFRQTKFAYEKAVEWSSRDEEFVKRAGFVMMAVLAVHEKKAGNERFIEFLAISEKESGDSRNFVKKAINWAVRQIGKRNKALNRESIKICEIILKKGSKTARWIATDALRELNSEAVRKRFKI